MSIKDPYHQRYIDKIGNVIGVRYDGPVGNQRMTQYNLGLGGLKAPLFEPNTGTLELPYYPSPTPVPIEPGDFQLPFYQGTDRGVDPEDFKPIPFPDSRPDEDLSRADRKGSDVVGEAASTGGRFLGEFLRKKLG